MNSAQTKQGRKAKKAVNRTNNLKDKANLKQGYHGSWQQIFNWQGQLNSQQNFRQAYNCENHANISV